MHGQNHIKLIKLFSHFISSVIVTKREEYFNYARSGEMVVVYCACNGSRGGAGGRWKITHT